MFEFYPAHDYYVVYFWKDERSINWHPVGAFDDIQAALARAEAERESCHRLGNPRSNDIYTVNVVWLMNVMKFIPFVGHDGKEWRWIHAEGLTSDQKRSLVITAATLAAAAFGMNAECGDRPVIWPPTQGTRVFIAPPRLKPFLLPGNTGEGLDIVVQS